MRDITLPAPQENIILTVAKTKAILDARFAECLAMADGLQLAERVIFGHVTVFYSLHRNIKYTMISVPCSAIPHYLHDSHFYNALDRDEEGSEIQIPEIYFTTEAVVESIADFHKMLSIMLFWGLDRIPKSMIDYCRCHPGQEWSCTAGDISNNQEQEILADLRNVFNPKDTTELDVISRAVMTGRIELVEYLAVCADVEKCGVGGTAAAAKVGNLLFLQILHDSYHWWDHTTTDEAARGGHLHCLQYAHEHGCPVDVSANTFAAEGGHFACLEYSHTVIGTAWHRDVCSAAASNGHFAILSYAHQHGCPWDDMTVENAARGNHVPCLQYALEHNCPVCEDALIAACQRGLYDYVVLLYDYLAPVSDSAISAAAWNRSLKCVTFLHEAGCEWTATATDNAARHGHYEVLRYLLSHGCPYSEQTLYLAASARNNSLRCVKYLIEEQGLFMDTDGSIFESAFERGDVDCVQYLMDIGCPYEEYDFYKIINLEDSLPEFFDVNLAKCIAYAVERGWRWNSDLWKYACKEELVACREYMRKEEFH